jgi:hypothetical protein
MPPKKSANERDRVSSYERKDGTRVRSHTRSAHWARSRAAWTGAGFAGLSATAILVEFGFTLISTTCVVLIAVLTGMAVLAGAVAEKNKKTMGRQQRRRTTRTRRTPSSSSRRRTSSHRRRTTGGPRRR